MDPYLKAHWGDIHHSLIQYAQDKLQSQLPTALRARVEERVFVESDDGWNRNIFPDVRIVERSGGAMAEGFQPAVEVPGDVAVAEPLVLLLPHESITEGFIEIRDASSGHQIVTVIEVLSAANKAGANGTQEYRRKATGNSVRQNEPRQRLIYFAAASASRRYRWRQSRRLIARRIMSASSAGWRGDEFEIFRAPLRERLPIIRIPLRRTDADVTLDLQGLVEQAYLTGRYDDDIDYRNDPEPPFDGDDARWADELLRHEGRR